MFFRGHSVRIHQQSWRSLWNEEIFQYGERKEENTGKVFKAKSSFSCSKPAINLASGAKTTPRLGNDYIMILNCLAAMTESTAKMYDVNLLFFCWMKLESLAWSSILSGYQYFSNIASYMTLLFV